MSLNSFSRVACLRIPHFQIAVLERSGRVRKGISSVLIHGTGDNTRVSALSRTAFQRGIRPGMLLSRALAVVSNLHVLASDESPVSQVTEYLLEQFHSLTPRMASAGIGCFWLEAISLDHEGEEGFVRQLFDLLRREEFDDVRLGIADSVVASDAAARLIGPYQWRSIRTGHDFEFLAECPLDVLPIGHRMRSLLCGVGILSIRELQSCSVESIQRRFGSAGKRAWLLSRGKDSRSPRTPVEELDKAVRVSLTEPTGSIESILFVLEQSTQRLSQNLRAKHRAATELLLGFRADDGRESHTHVAIHSPTFDSAMLVARIKYHLREYGLPHALTDGSETNLEIESVTLAVAKDVPYTPKQRSLWHSAALSPILRGCITAEMETNLGGVTFVTPTLRDSQKPEQQSCWKRRGDDSSSADTESSRVPAIPQRIRACMRMLDLPKRLSVRGSIDRPSEIFAENLAEFGWIRIFHWIGPETLSGGWWDGPYERDYFWVISEEQCAVWIFFDRLRCQWFVHGWLD